MSVGFKRVFLAGAMLALLAGGSAEAQVPDRIDVLIGFDRTPGAADEALVRGFGGAVKYRFHLVPGIAANIPENAVAALLRSPRVTSVELDGEVHAIDAELDNTWGVKRVGAGEVHAGGNTGAGVLVAVIDSGIDYNHSELDVPYAGGYDFANDDADPMDDNGHGTHVSGTVAAEDNNSGVVGMAPGVSIFGLKVLSASGSGSYSDVIAALEWVVDYNAGNGTDPDIRVTNNSYGSKGSPGSLVKAAFDNSYNTGILHIAAAGNSGNCGGKGDNVIYPARYDSVVAVAATNSSDGSPCFSSTGPDLELAAPGVSIKSSVPGGGYAVWNGTSMASPHVAGAAALIIASSVDALSNADVRQRLVDTAIDLGPAGRDTYYGYGLIDVVAATAAPGFVDASPWAEISEPVAGNDVSGASVPVSAGAGDDDAVVQVEFFVDGNSIGVDTDGTGGWSATWDTMSTCNGDHSVSATATDTGNQTGTDSVIVNVANDPDFCAAPEPEPDITPPNPDPMTWASAPAATGTSTIAMIAATASDDSGSVEYLFSCVTGGGNCVDGNWQASTSYTASGLDPDTSYSFQVRARDQFANMTAWSASASATTDAPGGATTMHVAALDGGGRTGRRNKWNAQVTITVRDNNDALVEGAAVSGTWSAGTKGGASCTTSANGTCTVTKNNLKSTVASVTLTVTDVTGSLTYDSGANLFGSVVVTRP